MASYVFFTEQRDQPQSYTELTVTLEQSGLKSRLTESHITALWRKAAILKSTASAIYPQPSVSLSDTSSSSNMICVVASFVGTVPQTVSITVKGNVVCNCPGFSSAKICSHSLGVANKEQCWMDFLSKFGRNSIKTTNLSTLENTGVNRDVLGKKGQRNKTRRQAGRIESNPSREEFPQFLDLTQTKLYKDIWQNDNPFSVVFISGNISKCASCGLSFPKTNRPIPYDIVLRHPGRYEYPDKDNPGQTEKSYRERNAYYHVDPQCVKQRHPHFDASFLRVDNEIKSKLAKVHFDYLQLHFNVRLES